MNNLINSYTQKEIQAVKNLISDALQETSIENNILENFVLGSSKYIRTVLTTMYLKAYGANIGDQSLLIMSAGELIHNASLLHDDVLDDADMRRGEQTIARKYSSSLSILLGDYLLGLAVEILQKVNDARVMECFLFATKSMCKSEITQFFKKGSIPEQDEFLKICEGKTATLFVAILQSCCIVENLDQEKASIFAKKFGIFFQLKNDLKKDSRVADIKNSINTLEDIIGLEKSYVLMDNYAKEIFGELSCFPDNCYKKGLEVLLREL